MIGVGICGCGFMGRTHFQVFENHPGARVVALMDTDERRRIGDWSEPLGNLPSRWPERVDMTGRTSHATLESLLADKRVDLAVIALPTHVHAEATIAALAAGKHVLCEKPMALTFADCRRIAEAARSARGLYMCGQCVRFWPQYVKIKELVDSGRFGRVRAVKLRRLASAPGYSGGGWLMDHRQSGGALFDLHVHDADFALHLLGEPRQVFARGHTGPSGGVDHVHALWTYDDDKVVSLEGGWCLPPGFPFEMYVQVRCEAATLQWPTPGQTDRNPVMIYHADGRSEAVRVADSSGWAEEVRYFLRCLAEGRAPAFMPAEQSANAVRLVELEATSLASGAALDLPPSGR